MHEVGERLFQGERSVLSGNRDFLIQMLQRVDKAAVTALDQAYRDYYAAVGDHNRAQFQLYRALGHPAQYLVNAACPSAPEEARNADRGTRNDPTRVDHTHGFELL